MMFTCYCPLSPLVEAILIDLIFLILDPFFSFLTGEGELNAGGRGYYTQLFNNGKKKG